MSLFEDYISQIKYVKILSVEELESILKDRREKVEFLKYVISVQELPEQILQTDIGKKLHIFNNKLSSEIENWLIIDDSICDCLREHKNGNISMKKSLNAFCQLAKRFRSELQFKKFQKEILVINNKNLNENINFRENSALIKSIPSYSFLKLVCFFFSPKTVKEVFEPIIADWQEE